MRSSTFSRRDPRSVRARSIVSGGTDCSTERGIDHYGEDFAIKRQSQSSVWRRYRTQIRNSGASATFGTLLSTTNSRNSKRSSFLPFPTAIRMANSTPNTVATAKPASVMPSV